MIYRGKQGIEQFKCDLRNKQKKMMQLAIINTTTLLVDDSPVGAEYYGSRLGRIPNDQGDYKNSWSVGLGAVDYTVRDADITGSGSLVDAVTKARGYSFQKNIYLTNSSDHAINVEYGWKSNPVYGWNSKQGYAVATLNEDNVRVALQAAMLQASRLR